MPWLLALFAYLLGSVSCAVLLSRCFHTGDPRDSGSGNPGATNMLRIAGRKLAILTLIGDLSKSLIPMLIAQWLGLSGQTLVWIGLCAVVGHAYPLFFGFQGGKGVATAAGVLLVAAPLAALVAVLLWGATFALRRTASLAALIALLGALPTAIYSHPEEWLPLSLLGLLVLWRHRQNWLDLLSGRERHF